MMNKWYDCRDNVLDVCSYLLKVKFYTPNDILNCLEKPWHYDNEWKEYQTSLEIDKGLDSFDRREK